MRSCFWCERSPKGSPSSPLPTIKISSNTEAFSFFARGHAPQHWRKVEDGETLASVLDEMGIPNDEIKHIFVNAKLLVTRTSSGPLYGYPQQRDSVFDWDLNLPLANGDRVGLFGLDLPVLEM